jgi:predicted permease
MDTLFQDLRFGWRMLRNKPGFSLVAILTLALGIGVNTAIFSIVNAVLLRSLPYRDPDSLVKIMFSNLGTGLHDVPFSVPELDDLKTRAGVFAEVSVVWPTSTNLTGAKEPQRLEALGVSPNYFSMLGATPQIGRLFGAEDFAAGFAPAVVISNGLWRRTYGADPNVLGRTLRLDNDPYTIVGVLPPGFRHPGPTISTDVEVWITAGFSADPFPKPSRSLRQLPGAIGRLKPGLSREQAQAKLNAMAIQLRHEFAADYPSQAQWTIEIRPLQESLVGSVRPMLLVVMGAVILIVLIVSLNIANLLLARASRRQQEMAVRLALGATRTRLIRQMLTESMMLALLGSVIGVATAGISLGFILRLVPANIPRLSEVNVDWVVLAFALLISVLACAIFGLAPAIQSTKSDLFVAIREGARGSGDSTKTIHLRDGLIVSQLTFAVVMMVGAGLLLRTFWELLEQNPGFDPTRVVAASIWLPVPNDPKVDAYNGLAPQTAFARELIRRMSAIPGVDLAGITSALPASSQTRNVALAIENHPVESAQDLRAEMIRVSPDYFKVMQAPLVQGRFFTENDESGKELVAIVDETTARRYWPGRDPLGRRLRLGEDAKLPWIAVVGIVKDIKHDGLDIDGVPHIYVPIYQTQGRVMSVVLRTSLPSSSLEAEIRQRIQSIDPGLPVFSITSMMEVIGASLARHRFSADLVGAFAGLALLLASIGIYGLLDYMVSQRSREIGLRMTLGAQPTDIIGLILKKGATLAGVGIASGMLLAAFAAPTISGLLYGIRPIDPTVFLLVPLVLLAVALLASYLPARRAAKVDPMIALREG